MTDDARGRKARIAPFRDGLLASVGLLVFECPSAILPNRFALELLRPSGEAFLLLIVALGTRRWVNAPGLRRALAIFAGVIFVFRVDRALSLVATRAEPNLYDQLFLAKHAIVLGTDLFGARSLWLASLLALGAALLVGLGRAAARAVMRIGARTNGLPAVLAAALVLSTAASTFTGVPIVRFTTPSLVGSVLSSSALSLASHRLPSERTLPPLPGVSRRPNVALLFVESYGRIVQEDSGLRAALAPALAVHSADLAARGVSAVSGFATAPVSGGRSWLAVASILLGTPIRTEVEWRRRVSAGIRGSLPQTLAQSGYDTVLLAPADRTRFGIERENPFGYAHHLGMSDLAYAGPAVGWGVVPDDFALERAKERLLSPTAAPVLFHFHMVSSHTPWVDVPRAPWRVSPHGPIRCAFAPIESWCEGYARSVAFDLAVALPFAAGQEDALALVLGDHQPPFLVPEGASFDVPVHVVARDPSLLSPFVERGFVPGISLAEGNARPIPQEELGALVLRAIARSRGAPTASR